ncbi:MAG: PCRF domain-containing protein, partial [Acidimicrobiia bacterium]
MDESFARRLTEIEDAFVAVENMLGDPEVLADSDQLAELGKKHSDLKDVVADIRRWRDAQSDLAEAKEMSSDPDMAQMARDLTAEIDKLEARIKVALTPTDPNDNRDVLVEIRSGVGGDEASIWAGDLLRMYEKYAERLGFKTETIESSPNEAGGFDKVTIA